MKNLLVSIAAVISGSILLSSCNQGASLTLTKRHYTKGYYVDYTSKHEAEKPMASIVNDKKENVTAVPLAEQPVIDEQQTTINDVASADNKTSVTQSVTEDTKTNSKQNVVKANKLVNYKPALSIVAIPKALSKSESQFENVPQGIAATTQDGEHRVHSFFWTVIAIILILWLIGILTGGFGLGVLINLLLLVAVVLFILWLLWLI